MASSPRFRRLPRGASSVGSLVVSLVAGVSACFGVSLACASSACSSAKERFTLLTASLNEATSFAAREGRPEEEEEEAGSEGGGGGGDMDDDDVEAAAIGAADTEDGVGVGVSASSTPVCTGVSSLGATGYTELDSSLISLGMMMFVVASVMVLVVSLSFDSSMSM